MSAPPPGYATAAPVYRDGGWHPFPLPRGQKTPPPVGITGEDGRDPTSDDIDAWCHQYPTGNVGLRMSTTTIGIDVDDYGDKDGAATLKALEATYGPLPPTWHSTSRGKGVSSIRFYSIPDGVKFPGVLGSSIEMIQKHHRYSLVAPSVHPETGERYRWWTPDDVQSTKPPQVAQLPPLPDRWVQGLRIDKVPQTGTQTPIGAPLRGTPLADDDSIAERINRDHHWHDVLTADGWHIDHHKGTESRWTRPGKASGTSGVLHEPDGPFNVFTADTTTVGALQQSWADRDGVCWSYSMFGYLAATRHNGDRSATAREYRAKVAAVDVQLRTYATAPIARAVIDGDEAAQGSTGDTQLLEMLVNWEHLWAQDPTDADWLAEPVLARGRSTAIYAPGGTGKSLFVLWLCAQLATGGPGLTGHPLTPIHVLYLDYEMTEADLTERLETMGFGPDTDLTRLHYALLPTIAPADAEEGGKAITRLAELVGADLVIIDTFSRAVQGDENDADTVRNWYRCTGIHLKAAGRAFARIDHAGKDVSKGQRGSSAKNDDVDVVWSLTAADNGFTLDAKKRRMGWVPETVALAQHDTPQLHYSVAARLDPPGTTKVIADLEELGVGVSASYRFAAQALKDAGRGVRNDLVRAAVKARSRRLQGVRPNV